MTTRTLVLAVAATLTTASLASAAITGVTGQTTLLGSPPVACTIGSLVTPNAYVWDEQSNVAITAGILATETQNPGGSASPVSGVLFGTFDSHFIHFDSSSGVTNAVGTVTFSQPIVGVIFRALDLDNSDLALGSLGTVYPTLFPFRNLAPGFFTISGNTLSFNFSAFVPTTDISQLRVLTHPVPAPAGLAVLGGAGLLALRRRR